MRRGERQFPRQVNRLGLVIGLLRHRISVRHRVAVGRGEPEGWGRWRQVVGGLSIGALASGDKVFPWTRLSKGGPCRDVLLKRPMVNALTLAAV
jgi:hypothetical protein